MYTNTNGTLIAVADADRDTKDIFDINDLVITNLVLDGALWQNNRVEDLVLVLHILVSLPMQRAQFLPAAAAM